MASLSHGTIEVHEDSGLKKSSRIFNMYSGALLLEPCLIVQPFLLFKIGWEWNGLTIHEVKLLGYWFRKP